MKHKHLAVGALCLLLGACGDKADQNADMSDEAVMDDTMMPMDDMSQSDTSTQDTVAQDASFDAPVAPTYGPNDIVYAMTDRDSTARLTLTPTNITMRLAQDAVERVQGQVRSRDLKDDLKAAILSTIQEVAITELENSLDAQRQKMSRHQIRYRLTDVNTIFFQGNRLWIDLQNEKALTFDDIRAPNGRPVLANFDAAQAMEFVAAYESVK